MATVGEGLKPPAKSERTVLLPSGSCDWLEAQTARFALSDSGKAFRCCINWACQTRQRFGAVAGSTQERVAVCATDEQWQWLEQEQCSPAALLALARSALDAAEIFEVVRCKSKTGAGGQAEPSSTDDAAVCKLSEPEASGAGATSAAEDLCGCAAAAAAV